MTQTERITRKVARRFRCFGKYDTTPKDYNPIAAALADREPMFAAGVYVEAVVMFILRQAKRKHTFRPSVGRRPKH